MDYTLDNRCGKEVRMDPLGIVGLIIMVLVGGPAAVCWWGQIKAQDATRPDENSAEKKKKEA